jgi:hypothetical protein
MKEGPSWEANMSAAKHEIPRILWNLKVRHRIHKRPLYVLILSQISRVHSFPSHFLKVLFLILSSHLCLGLQKIEMKIYNNIYFITTVISCVV